MSHSMIEVQNLTRVFRTYKKAPGFWGGVKGLFNRTFEDTAAAKDISFTIQEGEFVGFLGPNGAGKTTTLKMLSGLIYPTSGKARVAGFDPSKRENAYRKIFALVMGQKNQLWWDIPPQETFLLNKAIYEISDVDYKKRLDFFVENLDIANIIQVQTKKLSLGQRMKCEFVAALLHQPQVIFLDEPTIGLDVIASLKIREFIKKYNQEYKTTVILTSHNMIDVQELCHRVILIDKGQIRFDGQLSQLASQFTQEKILKFSFSENVPKKTIEKYGEITEHNLVNYTIKVPKAKYLNVASSILSTLPVIDLNIEDTPIEDVIRQVYSHR